MQEKSVQAATDKDIAGQPAKKAGLAKLWKAIRCVVFLSLLFYLTLHMSYVLRQVPERNAKNVFPGFYAEPDNSLDVVTLGSSACYQYVDTPKLYENFGITSYNLGCPIQSTISTPFLMDEVEKTQSPELFLVEVRRYIKGRKNNFSKAVYLMTDTMKLGLNKWGMICRAYDSIAERVTEFLDIYKYHSYWSGVDTTLFEFWNNEKVHPMKRWRNRQGVRPMVASPVVENAEPTSLHKNTTGELIYLLEECRKKGRNVLFFVSPYPYGDYLPGRVAALREIIESYGYTLLDMSDGEAYGLDYSTDFADSLHVNYLGAEKVTNALGEYIQKEYNIHTQHTPEVTADWERYVKANNEIVEQIRAGKVSQEETDNL